jgi:hypothetical protein
MSKFVFSFRSQKGRTVSAAEEAAWGNWFQEIAPNIAEFGNRVGDTSPLGNTGTDTELAGYVVVNADDLESAAALAKGCPGLEHGGGVEVGATVDMG